MEGMRLAGNKIYVGIACRCWIKNNFEFLLEMCKVMSINFSTRIR